MRNEEAIGVEAGSWRSEVRDGVEFHWVATTEHKTGKGKVEFLIPELTVKVLDLMSHYAKPLQEKLALEIAELECNPTHQDRTSRMLRLAKAKRDARKLFLCTAGLGRVNRLAITLTRCPMVDRRSHSGDWRRLPARNGSWHPTSAEELTRATSLSRAWGVPRLSSSNGSSSIPA